MRPNGGNSREMRDLVEREFARAAKILGLAPRGVQRSFLLDLFAPGSVGMEICVHNGDFSAELLSAVAPRELHLVDPWHYETGDAYKKALYGGESGGGQPQMDRRYQRVLRRFDAEIASGQVKVHRAFSSDALETFPDGYFDWIYIDGNHLYEFVKADLRLSLRKTRPGGYITGDDYGHGGWWQGGVKRAVDEFRRTEPVDVIAIKNAQFAFRRKIDP